MCMWLTKPADGQGMRETPVAPRCCGPGPWAGVRGSPWRSPRAGLGPRVHWGSSCVHLTLIGDTQREALL